MTCSVIRISTQRAFCGHKARESDARLHLIWLACGEGEVAGESVHEHGVGEM